MTTFRWLWEIHKWSGLILGCLLVLSASTGLLLLVKKDYGWIQPPTQHGSAGPAESIAPIASIYSTVFALGLSQFREEADIARIEFRPERRVFKVRSVRDDMEVQVDAISLRTWPPAPRRSDWIERLHDGSLFGDWAHDLLMPIAGVGFLLLTVSGYLVWLWPKIVARRAARRRAGA